MGDAGPLEESHRKKVRDWLLAILRFAVTLEVSDRAAVMMIAEHLDDTGSRLERTGFCFFSKTSTEFCGAIVDRNNPQAASRLERHLRRIDDPRLRRALEAAIAYEPNSPAVKKSIRENLWKGLLPS
jgi:hypothetical protein